MNRIPNGTIVTWTSQANASAKKKTGTVIAFVPAWAVVYHLPEVEGLQIERRAFDMPQSSIDRYLVRVDRQGKHKALPPIYYLPSAVVIERQNRSKP